MPAEKRELVLDLLSRNKMGPGTRAAASDLDKVTDSADKLDKRTVSMAKSATRSGEAVEGLGDASAHTSRLVSDLDADIAKVNQNLAFMHESFARATSQAEKLDISKGIRKAENDLRRMTKSRDFLQNLLPDPGPMAASFMTRLGTGIRAAGPALGPFMAGAVAYAMPLVGATVAAGIIGGAGGAGIIGGVVGASKDPRVKAAGTDLSNTLMGDLRARGKVFVGPILQGIGRIRADLKSAGGDMDRLFGNSSKLVQPLVVGIGSAMKSIVRGLADASGAAPPIFDSIKEGVAGLGDAVGDVFSGLKDNGVDAAVALGQAFQLVEIGVRAAGAAVNVLVESYGFLAKYGAFGKDAQREYLRLSANAKIAAGANGELGESFQGVTDEAVDTTARLQEMEDAMQDLLGANRDLYGSTVDTAEAIANTTEKIKENGRGLSLNTEKGRENRAALSSLAETLSRNYEAYVKVNGAGRGAQQVLERNRAAFIRLAEKAGYSAGQSRRLANELLGIPKKTNPTVNVSGTASGISKLQALKKQLASIKNRTVYVRVAHIEGRKLKVEDQLARGGNREFGGPVRRGHAYVVGEKRAEVFVPDRDGRIVPSIEQYARQGGHALPTMNPHQARAQRAPAEARLTMDLVGAEGYFKDFIMHLFRTTNLGNAR